MPDQPLSTAGPADAGPDRRRILALAGATALTGLVGCAAPAPKPTGPDPMALVYPPPPETPRFFHDRTLWGSNDVVIETGSDRLRRFATGESARGQGFAKPFGVVAHEGRVFISDTVQRLVHVLDRPRGRYYQVGHRGVGRLSKPLGVAVDRAGHLYVVDGSARRVIVFDLEGNYVTSVGSDKTLERPTGVAVTADGQRIHVLDTGGVRSSNHRVTIYDPRGKVLTVIGKRGGGEGAFNLPLDCCLDAEGRLYVLDTGNFRCQVFAPDGRFLWRFGEAGRFPGQFGHPKGIAVDAEGKIYISDTSFGVFQLFNPEGRILMAIGERNEQQGPGRFILPAGISVDLDGRIYVVDQFFRKVEVFRPAGLAADAPVGQAPGSAA